jgi:hypothetical protein
MAKITEKDVKMMKYLIDKVILKRLNDIDKEEEAKKKKAIGLSEVIDNSMEKAMIKLALKKSNAIEFEKLPVKSKAEKLKEQIEALQKSTLGKFGEEQAKKEKERKEAEELDRYYEDWVSKNGRSL